MALLGSSLQTIPRNIRLWGLSLRSPLAPPTRDPSRITRSSSPRPRRRGRRGQREPVAEGLPGGRSLSRLSPNLPSTTGHQGFPPRPNEARPIVVRPAPDSSQSKDVDASRLSGEPNPPQETAPYLIAEQNLPFNGREPEKWFGRSPVSREVWFAVCQSAPT